MSSIALYHEPVHTDGVTFDTYGPYARYIFGFAKYFDHVTVFAPVTDKDTYFSGVSLESPKITVILLPYFDTHAQAYRKTFQLIKTFKQSVDSIDAVIARGTAPLAYMLWWMMKKRNKPFLYHFASNPFEVINSSIKYKGLKGLFAKSAYSCEFQIQKYIMKRTYSFTSGKRLCEKLKKVTPNIEAVFTSSLQEEDYYLRQDCCLGETIKLLYVGYLRHGKGIEYLLEALKSLLDNGLNCELHLVGSGEYQNVLKEKAVNLGINVKVFFHGFAVTGPELNKHYNNCDIFVFPSLSEGSPKVIIEALAHSLPVVATKVGNIDETLDNGNRGILVPPKNPQALADGINKIITNTEFRQECINEGFEYSKKFSVDAFIKPMAMKTLELIEKSKNK